MALFIADWDSSYHSWSRLIVPQKKNNGMIRGLDWSKEFQEYKEERSALLLCLNSFCEIPEELSLYIALKRKRAYGGLFMVDLELAVAPMHRLCKKAGADRVSEAAAKELAKALEGIGVKIAKEALDFAMHAGRKTIKSEDIEIAARKVMGK
jgi:histone H3/H4